MLKISKRMCHLGFDRSRASHFTNTLPTWSNWISEEWYLRWRQEPIGPVTHNLLIERMSLRTHFSRSHWIIWNFSTFKPFSDSLLSATALVTTHDLIALKAIILEVFGSNFMSHILIIVCSERSGYSKSAAKCQLWPRRRNGLCGLTARWRPL